MLKLGRYQPKKIQSSHLKEEQRQAVLGLLEQKNIMAVYIPMGFGKSLI